MKFLAQLALSPLLVGFVDQFLVSAPIQLVRRKRDRIGWAELACFPENKHLATREHDALAFDQLIEIGCTFLVTTCFSLYDHGPSALRIFSLI